MTLSKLWTNYSVQFPGAVYFDGITDLALNTALSTQVEAADGNYFASFGALNKGAPVARFTTLDLAIALGTLGATSFAVTANLILFFRRIASGGTRDAPGAGTHISATIGAGIAVPRRISARSGDNAKLDVEVIATQAAGTSPVAFSIAANLPGNTPGVQSVWTVGPVVLTGGVGGTIVDGLSSVDVDFGVNVLAESRDSDIYPSFASINSQRPSVRLQGMHADVINTLAADGTYYVASSVIVYFKKRTEGGSFVANATAQHIKITFGKCRVEVQGFGSDPKTVDVLITPWQDLGGSVNPIAVNTAAAIV